VVQPARWFKRGVTARHNQSQATAKGFKGRPVYLFPLPVENKPVCNNGYQGQAFSNGFLNPS